MADRIFEQLLHSKVRNDILDNLDEGSEHIVYLVSGGKAVLKLTKPGIYGDVYFIEEGRVHQRCSTPADYLLRLVMIRQTFGFAPRDVGVTALGQIVSLQKFVKGDPPTQQEVNDFLLGEGIEPVKQSCWLWKRRDQEAEVDFWIGDARADNFVKTQTGIVPIDLRMCGVVLNEESTNI